jgi:hypothetical protein
MTYLAQDRALIESLSEQVLCGTCSSSGTTCDTGAAAATAAAPAAASADAAAAVQDRSLTALTGGTTDSAGIKGLLATTTAAEGGHNGVLGSKGLGSSVGQGTSGFGASQLGHSRQQLLTRAAELDAESAQHAAAAQEAGRMAAAYAVEGSECEVSLKSEVVVERRRLQERLEVGTCMGLLGLCRNGWWRMHVPGHVRLPQLHLLERFSSSNIKHCFLPEIPHPVQHMVL